MDGNKDSYYWDTCLFISWLADEKRPAGDMDGVREVIARIKKRDVLLVTSALTLAEILPSRYPAGVYNLFDDLLKRTTIKVVGVDRKIAKLAGDLRGYYDKTPHSMEIVKKLAVPDAIHLATAIIHGVTEFHTFDSGKKRKDSLGLLPLNGNVAGHALTICKPTSKQPCLDFTVSGEKKQKSRK